MIDYNMISDAYVRSHEKPDKKYVMRTTASSMLGSLDGKTVVDVGCGDGFFTQLFAKRALRVIGIDNSQEQLAKATRAKNIEYNQSDMFNYDYPKIDAIFAPFVLNYVQPLDKITRLFDKFSAALHSGGTFATILDMPRRNVHNMQEFGTIKRVDSLTEGLPMKVELYDNQGLITTLHSTYHTQQSITNCLTQTGFQDVQVHDPIVCDEGIKRFGLEFWKQYSSDCDSLFLSAKR